MLAADDGEDGDDERVEERPDETRHCVEVVAEQLQGEAGGVVHGDVVAEYAENEEHEAELREAGWVEGFQKESAQ